MAISKSLIHHRATQIGSRLQPPSAKLSSRSSNASASLSGVNSSRRPGRHRDSVAASVPNSGGSDPASTSIRTADGDRDTARFNALADFQMTNPLLLAAPHFKLHRANGSSARFGPQPRVVAGRGSIRDVQKEARARNVSSSSGDSEVMPRKVQVERDPYDELHREAASVMQ